MSKTNIERLFELMEDGRWQPHGGMHSEATNRKRSESMQRAWHERKIKIQMQQRDALALQRVPKHLKGALDR